MRAFAALVVLSAVAGAVEQQSHDGVFGAYFANWAQYRKAPFKHTAADVGGLKGIADQIYYGFVYFCPPAGVTMPYWGKAPYGSCSDSTEYHLMTLEKNDPASIKTLTSDGFKVVASIGGWNFPSHYFSQMVSTKTNRAKFITNAKSFLTSMDLLASTLIGNSHALNHVIMQ